MGIGGSIALIVLGLILALAVHIHLAGLDLQVIGWILTITGVVSLVVTTTILLPRSRRTVVLDQGSGVDQPVTHRRTIDEDPL